MKGVIFIFLIYFFTLVLTALIKLVRIKLFKKKEVEELKENLDNIDDEVNEEIEVKNEIVEEKSIDTEETVIKDFFIKETGISLKEMAILFGQTEEEISKEYGSFKAK